MNQTKYDHCYEAYAALSRRHVVLRLEVARLQAEVAILREQVTYLKELLDTRRQVDELKDQLLLSQPRDSNSPPL